MKFRSTWLFSLLALGGSLLIGGRASAQFVNGNFETGTLTGWTLVTGSSAIATTTPGTPFTYSTTFNALLTAGTATSATIAAELTAGNTLGYTVTVTQLNSLTSPDDVGDGAVIFQQFSGVGPVTFVWGFDSAEGVGAGFNDTLFVFLDGTFFDLRDANVNPDDTAYQSFTSASLPAGNHFIAIGVLNGTDTVADSRGIFDNFSIAAVGVPEPTTWALLGGVALSAGLYRPISRRVKKLTGR